MAGQQWIVFVDPHTVLHNPSGDSLSNGHCAYLAPFMDDSDDYFDDDLVLDAQTIAILDREEQKFFSQKQHLPPPPVVTKKQKTRDGWSPGVGSRPREHELDDLPEISVTADGNYGFTGSSGSSNFGQPLFVQTPQSSNVHRDQNLQNGKLFLHAQPAPSVPQPMIPAASNRISPTPNARPRNTTSTNRLIPHENLKQLELQKQIAGLQTQLLELETQNQRFQTALKEATEIRYAKEGEVSILRKNMEKVHSLLNRSVLQLTCFRQHKIMQQRYPN